MTCYQRHLGWLFDAVDRPFEQGSKREVHRAVVEQLGLPADAKCPEVWSALKETYGIDARTQSVELAADISARLGQSRV